MDHLLHDLRFAVRLLTKRPGFAALAVITLALGIGANSAIFSVVNAVLINPLPYAEPDRLVMIWHENAKTGDPNYPFSYPNFTDLRDQSRGFDQIAAITPLWSVVLRGIGDPERLEAHFVSGSFFRMLGVSALRGRVFLDEDDREGAPPVALISQRLWQDRFGSDPGIVGRQVTLDATPVTIGGVIPAGFQLFEKVDLWLPLIHNPFTQRGRAVHLLRVVARLQPTVTLEQARAEVAAIAEGLASQYPDSNTDLGANAVSLREQIVGDVRPALLMLLGAVGLVLLIACANVASLMLARAAAREREIGVRLALGAGRWRLIRQLLTESVVLAIVAGAAGLLIAYWGIDILRSLGPAQLPRLDEVGVDPSVLLFTFGASVLTGLLFGLVPALQASRISPYVSLKEGARSSISSSRFGRSMVVAETALALMLLLGAGLLIRSFVTLLQVDPGFGSERLLTMQVMLPPGQYQQAGERTAFFDQLFSGIASIPGVESVGGATRLPMLSGVTTTLEVEGRDIPQGQRPEIEFRRASTDYFRAMGIPLIGGRVFTDQDSAGSSFVAIINERAAKVHWPGEDAIGKRIRFFGGANAPWAEIIGVVGDVRHFGLDEDVRPEIYISFNQGPPTNPLLAIRTSLDDPRSIISSVRDRIRSLNPDLTIYNVATMDELVARKLAERRFSMLLLGLFAVLALVLAATGVYGVISYAVNQRTAEIGVRVALGARRGQILMMVLGQGMRLALIGTGLGLIGAFATSRLISGLLYGIGPADPLTFGVIPLVLLVVAALACLIPAHRATRIDPMAALRYE